jgi:hypothetical protein
VAELLSAAQINSLEAKMNIVNALEKEVDYTNRKFLLNRIFSHSLLVHTVLQYSQKVAAREFYFL